MIQQKTVLSRAWRFDLADQDPVQQQIAETVAKHPVLLFVKGTKQFPQCGFSAAVIDVFQRIGVPFETVNVLADAGVREGIKRFTSWPTIPQVFVAGKFIGGCDIVREMYSSGELEPLVKAAAAK